MGTDASQNRQPSVFGLLAAAGGHSSYEGVPPARAMQSGVVRTDCRGRWRRGSVTEWPTQAGGGACGGGVGGTMSIPGGVGHANTGGDAGVGGSGVVTVAY